MIEQIVTKKDLITNFKEIGVQEGMILEVHSSLSSFGYVVGGAQTVVDALIEAVGYEGTLLMPMQTSSNTEPSAWVNPPAKRELFDEIRANMPAFDKKSMDAFHMGAIVDNLRRRDGVVISNHPSCAFVAWGKYAKLLCNHQSLHFSLSEESPLARLYELRGHVLLLGVDYDNCTLLHLAEYRSGVRPVVLQGSCVLINDKPQWKKYLDIELDSDDFKEIGKILESNNIVSKAKVGNCNMSFFKGDVAVDIATKCFENLDIAVYNN